MKLQAGVPAQFWGDCVLAAAHITNRLPTPVLQNTSPYEVLYKCKPDYHNLNTFGCFVIAYNPSKSGDKLDVRGIPCIFIGYPTTQRGYRLFNLQNNTTIVTRHLKFYEHLFPYQVFNKTTKRIVQCDSEPTREWYDTEVDTNHHPSAIHPETSSDPHDTGVETTSNPPDAGGDNQPETQAIPAPRKSSRAHRPPTWLSEYHTHMAHSVSPQKVSNCITLPTSSQFWCFAT